MDGHSFELSDGDFMPLYNWHLMSRKVLSNCRIFRINLNDYVTYIEKYYYNVKMSQLKRQYEFIEDAQYNCIGIDYDFLLDVFDKPLDLLSYEEITILRNYNIDFEKFFNVNQEIRNDYFNSLSPFLNFDFLQLCKSADDFINKKSRTKRKNDYLTANGLEYLIY